MFLKQSQVIHNILHDFEKDKDAVMKVLGSIQQNNMKCNIRKPHFACILIRCLIGKVQKAG